MSASPHIISQSQEEEPTMAPPPLLVPAVAKKPPSSQPPKQLAQLDLFGKLVVSQVKTIQVKGFKRKDGSAVAPHTRTVKAASGVSNRSKLTKKFKFSKKSKSASKKKTLFKPPADCKESLKMVQSLMIEDKIKLARGINPN